MTRPESPAGDSVAVALRILREIVEGLKGSETGLRAVHGSRAPSQDDETDAAMEIRTVIECVLTDSLGPAIRDLQNAASDGA